MLTSSASMEPGMLVPTSNHPGMKKKGVGVKKR